MAVTLSSLLVSGLAYSGWSGTSGSAGSTGTSGWSGTSGSAGTSGTSGWSGTSGSAGSTGTSGWSGTSGSAGTSGWSGTSGIGTSGWSGTSGAGGGFTSTNDNSTNATHYPLSATTAGGTVAITSSTGLTFNPSTGTLSATIFNSTSDVKQKSNIRVIQDALTTILSLEGVEFTFNKTDKKSAGIIAQDLESILPHLVSIGDDGFKSVNYSGIIGYLINAIKEQQLQINKLNIRHE